MRLQLIAHRAFVAVIGIALSGIALFATAAVGAEVKVMISGGFTPAYQTLVSEFERTTGN